MWGQNVSTGDVKSSMREGYGLSVSTGDLKTAPWERGVGTECLHRGRKDGAVGEGCRLTNGYEGRL